MKCASGWRRGAKRFVITKPKPLALVGMMGAGKSTVAGLIASLLEIPSRDLDTLVEVKTGLTVGELFDQQGQAAFRSLEQIAFGGLHLEMPGPFVLALGGGAPVTPSIAAVLKTDYRVVWLDADPALLFNRAQGRQRPLTQGGFAKFSQIYAQRRPVYAQVAALRVDVAGMEPSQVAAVIADWWKGG